MATEQKQRKAKQKSQYQNFVKNLADRQCEMVTDEKTFYETKEMTYRCLEAGHETQGTVVYILHKFPKCKPGEGIFCAVCRKKAGLEGDKLKSLQEQVLEASGHIVTSFAHTKSVTFTCGNCGSTDNHSTKQNLLRNGDKCASCQNETFKLSENKVRDIIKPFGCKLVSYTSYHNITVRCKCGNEYKTNIGDIKRGKNCMRCKPVKFKETCQERYQQDNTFQVEAFKEKAKQTNLKNLGVEYPQQNPQVNQKTQETCLETLGQKFAFHTDEAKIAREKVFHKALETSFSAKEHKLPSGKIVKIMGFENETINFLLKTTHPVFNRPVTEEELLIGEEVQTVIYYDDNGGLHRYYPDMAIPSCKYIYEVKCVFTFNRTPRMNFLKFCHAAHQGYTVKVFMYKDRKTLVDIWTFVLEDGELRIRSVYARNTKKFMTYDIELKYEAPHNKLVEDN